MISKFKSKFKDYTNEIHKFIRHPKRTFIAISEKSIDTLVKKIKRTLNKPNKNEYIEALYSLNYNLNKNNYVEKSNRTYMKNENDIKLISFYLPQFHTFKENNEWWGEGFTEWTNVTKAVPQYVGHYQPKLPSDLGFYDLSHNDIFYKQIDLAKKYGIYGFCFHYYWFSGKRLMEKPIFNYLNDKNIDFPFMLCWANENWTRSWNGRNEDVLISQNFEEEDYLKFIEDIFPFFQDERYIKINNKPVFIIYRPDLFGKDKMLKAINIWRQYAKDNGFEDLYIINSQAFGFKDNPADWNINASVEFPPHNTRKENIKDNFRLLNPEFNGHIDDISKYLKNSYHLVKEDYTLYKTAFPDWDSTARRLDRAYIKYGMTPDNYKQWLTDIIKFTKENYNDDEQFVFINAWNEWAEGAYLEPDRRYGYANLEKTLDAIIETRE